MSFWAWLIRGCGSGPGLLKFVNWWLILHVAVASILACLVSQDLKALANGVLLPLAGIFVGLSFAWAANAQAMLQSDEIEKLASFHAGGLAEYVFGFQLGMLLILGTLSAWGLAGLGLFEYDGLGGPGSGAYLTITFALFLVTSMTVRECWNLVLVTQVLILARAKIRMKIKDTRDTETEGKDGAS